MRQAWQANWCQRAHSDKHVAAFPASELCSESGEHHPEAADPSLHLGWHLTPHSGLGPVHSQQFLSNLRDARTLDTLLSPSDRCPSLVQRGFPHLPSSTGTSPLPHGTAPPASHPLPPKRHAMLRVRPGLRPPMRPLCCESMRRGSATSDTTRSRTSSTKRAHTHTAFLQPCHDSDALPQRASFDRTADVWIPLGQDSTLEAWDFAIKSCLRPAAGKPRLQMAPAQNLADYVSLKRTFHNIAA